MHHVKLVIFTSQDIVLKADLQSLLPLDAWEAAREAARLQASALRDASSRASGEQRSAAKQLLQVCDPRPLTLTVILTLTLTLTLIFTLTLALIPLLAARCRGQLHRNGLREGRN